MKRPVMKLFAACLAAIAAGAWSGVTSSAEDIVGAQNLEKVNASGQVVARWTRQPDTYTVQVVMERSKPRPKVQPVGNLEPKPPVQMQTPTEALDRSQFFIGNTIANLRGLDPTFGCNRTLTLVDGRRTLDGRAAENATRRVPPVLPYDPKSKQPRVEVWLLKADGTQIPSADFRCISYPESTEARYEYPAADVGQAVAAAIRIDDEYYIEKLQQLQLTQSEQ